jgi:hypothetical protein
MALRLRLEMRNLKVYLSAAVLPATGSSALLAQQRAIVGRIAAIGPFFTSRDVHSPHPNEFMKEHLTLKQRLRRTRYA